MMVTDNRDGRAQTSQVSAQPRPDLRVGAHYRPLFIVQWSVLEQYSIGEY